MHLTHRRTFWTLTVCLTLLVAAPRAQQPKRVDEALLKTAGSTEDWLTHGQDQGEKRYSPLKQIDTTTVGRLAKAWSFDVPTAAGGPSGGNQETTLLAWNNTLFGMTTWSVVFAVDA